MRDRYDVEQSFFSDVVKVALGVFIGGLAAAFAYETITQWRAQQVLQKMAIEMQQERREKAQAARQAQQRRDELTRQRQEAQRQEQHRQERRANAWQQYYKPSPSCRVDPSTPACANEYMAARKRFDAAYRDQ